MIFKGNSKFWTRMHLSCCVFGSLTFSLVREERICMKNLFRHFKASSRSGRKLKSGATLEYLCPHNDTWTGKKFCVKSKYPALFLMIPTKYKKYFKILFITKYYEVTILTGKNNFLFPDVKIKSFQKRFPKSSQTASSTKMEKRAHEKNKIQFVVYTYIGLPTRFRGKETKLQLSCVALIAT